MNDWLEKINSVIIPGVYTTLFIGLLHFFVMYFYNILTVINL